MILSAALQKHRQRWRSAQQDKTYIVPTRFGYGYVLLILLMLLGAINYNNSLGHLLSFLLVSLGHITMHHSYRNLCHLRFETGLAQSVFSGQPIQLPLTLMNERRHDMLQLEVAYLHQAQPQRWNPLQHFSKYQSCLTISQLQAQQHQSQLISLPGTKRGWVKLGRLRLSSIFPLGLFVCWRLIELNQNVLIYPKPEGQKALPASAGKSHAQSPQQLTGKDDFAGFQNYRDGDPKHQIAWKALARDEVLRTKQFHQPQGEQQWLQWKDVDEITDTEAKLSQLCRWVLTAETLGHAYGLSLPDKRIEPSLGDSHRHQCLKALALYGQN